VWLKFVVDIAVWKNILERRCRVSRCSCNLCIRQQVSHPKILQQTYLVGMKRQRGACSSPSQNLENLAAQSPLVTTLNHSIQRLYDRSCSTRPTAKHLIKSAYPSRSSPIRWVVPDIAPHRIHVELLRGGFRRDFPWLLVRNFDFINSVR
jgi:hypothetical protein